MTFENKRRNRPSLSMPILRIARLHEGSGTLTLGALLASLGEASFGWAIVVFSLLTMLPLPPGSSVVTALPVLVTTLQMLLGYRYVKLPAPLARLRIDDAKLRRTILRLRPLTRRLERALRPRYGRVFSRQGEQFIGALCFAIAFALFLPIPLSGWFPAISLLFVGIGLVERDGVITLIGLAMGALSVALTTFLALSLAAGAETLID